MNKENTELFVIGTKQQRQSIQLSSVQLEGEVIQDEPEVRNLGVIIRCYLTTEARKRLVHAVVMSRLDYCNVLFWGFQINCCNQYKKFNTRQPESLPNISPGKHNANIEITALVTDKGMYGIPDFAMYKAKAWLSTTLHL